MCMDLYNAGLASLFLGIARIVDKLLGNFVELSYMDNR